MNTLVVTYDPKNKIAKGLIDVLAKTDGVEIDDDAILTEEEIRLIEKSKKSGICKDISQLQEYIKSQLYDVA